jgi:hypothetical protein
MRFDRHLSRLLGVVLTLAVAACGSDRTAPTAAVSSVEASSAELNATLNAERARTANSALASIPKYDSLVASYSPDLIGDLVGGTVNTVQSLLLQCSPLPYASDVKTIGSGGGILRAGPHTLVIPKGALSKNTVITMEAPTAPRAQVTFKPHGLTFSNWSKPVLTLSYKHCSGLGMLLPKKIVYTDDLLKILETLISLDLPKNKLVSSPLSHFSSYVVAY